LQPAASNIFDVSIRAVVPKAKLFLRARNQRHENEGPGHWGPLAVVSNSTFLRKNNLKIHTMLPERRPLHLVVDDVHGLAFFEQESSMIGSPAPLGLALLLPGLLAYRLGRVWLASIFAISAVLSFIYHVVESNVPSPWATLWLRQSLRLLDGGSVYFCLLQLGFVVIGPEETPCDCGKLDAARIDFLVARVVPSVAMLVFLSTRSSWPEFHWQCMILLDVLWLLGFTVFWFQPARRAAATEVLLRTHYWLRLWKEALLPTAFLSIFVVALQATVSHADTAGRTVFALLAARMISASHVQGEKLRESQRLQELQGLSPSWNPMVARQLLGAPGLLGMVTIAASLVADLYSSHSWPLLSRPVHARPGGYLVVLGALPSLLAMAAALWLVSSSTGSCAIFESEEISLSRGLGCLSGYLSILLGLLTLLLHSLDLPVLQTVSHASSMGFMVLAVLGTAFGSVAASTWSRCLCLWTLFTASLLSCFVVLLLLDQQLIPNKYHVPHELFALMEYLSVAAYLLWPLAWAREVHSSWQLHKAWPSKPIQMA